MDIYKIFNECEEVTTQIDQCQNQINEKLSLNNDINKQKIIKMLDQNEYLNQNIKWQRDIIKQVKNIINTLNL